MAVCHINEGAYPMDDKRERESKVTFESCLRNTACTAGVQTAEALLNAY